MSGHPTLGQFALRGTFSWPELFAVEESHTVFEDLGAYRFTAATLRGDGAPEQLWVGEATRGLFATLGVSPLRGRLFDASKPSRDAGEAAVLLTESTWVSRFGGDESLIGSRLDLDGEPHTVIGVLPAGVEAATLEVDLWTLKTPAENDNPGNHNINGAVARLKDEVPLQEAQLRLAQILEETAPPDHSHGASVFPRLQDQTRNLQGPLKVLITASFLLLAVGCANTALIVLGLGFDRQQELAMRGALGARRTRIVRQLLSESLLLVVAAALAGVLMAFAITRGLLYIAPEGVSRIENASVDWRTLAFAGGVALISGVLFSLAPALNLSRPDLAVVMRAGQHATQRRSRLESALVVGELALTTLLLISAALLGRTLHHLNTVETGLAIDEVVGVRMAMPFDRFDQEDEEAQRAAIDAYFQSIIDEIAALPQVKAVAVTSNLPLSGDRGNNGVLPEGWDPERDGDLIAERRFVSANYFQIVGTRVLEGRGFDQTDDLRGTPATIVLSEGLASRAWPDESAIGKKISFWGREPATVIGVAENVRDESLATPTELAFYVPARQLGAMTGTLLLRTEASAAELAPPIRERIRLLHPDVPVTRVVALTTLVGDSTAQQRYRLRLMVSFGALASAFALLGVYAVIARSVNRRTREIGIRVAVGAVQARVVALVMGDGLRLALWGCGTGLLASLVLTRLLDRFLIGVSRLDPLSLFAVAAAVAVAAIVVALPHCHRATNISPTTALREE